MGQRLALGALSLVGVVLFSGTARAQAVATGSSSRADPNGRERLMSRFGVSAGKRLVDDPVPTERRRGLERLAALGTPEAIEALLGAMDSGSPLARDPVLRLHAVRLLAKFADRNEVRSYLVRELMDAAGRRDPTAGFPALLRETAALALARQGGEDAVAALVTAASLRGPAGDAARQALVVAPPPTLDPLLYESDDTFEEDDVDIADADADDAKPEAATRGQTATTKKSSKKNSSSKADKRRKAAKTTKAKDADDAAAEATDSEGDEGASARVPGKKTPRVLTPLTLTLLGDLGDLRAIPALRAELERTDRGARIAAGLALAKLGDGAAGDVAARWANEKDPKLALAAVDILVMLGRREATPLVKKLLSEDASRASGVRLAFDVASPELASALDIAILSLEPKDAARAMVALGRSGEVKRLVVKVADPVLGPSAMTGLAISPEEGAAAAIAAGLAGKDVRRFARVGVARALYTGERVPGLVEALQRLRTSKDDSDRETAALGLVALGEETPAALLGDAKKLDRAILIGASRGALARPTDEVLAGFEPLLTGIDAERPSLEAIAAGIALLSPTIADRVPRATLLRLAENGGPLAGLAARALPRRDDGTITARVSALLRGTDPTIRVAVALGLEGADLGAASTMLGNAYLAEDDVRVRRALVWALGRRNEPQRLRYLAWASELDPDRSVRSMAKTATRGKTLPALDGVAPAPHGVLITEVRGKGDASEMQALRIVTPSGLALPVVSAADGGLIVPGVPFGRSVVELAPGTLNVDSASP